MGNLSIFWLIVITIFTIYLYIICSYILNSPRKKAPLICIFLSTFLYSGVGIAYLEVDKYNIIQYGIFLFCVGITYVIIISIKTTSVAMIIDKKNFWIKKNTKIFFQRVVIFYILLRITSLIYPINKLSNFELVFNSINNINNLTGKEISYIGSICTLIYPFYLIGIYYICKKVKFIAVFLSFDLVVTLINTGYLSRYRIIAVVIICLLLYFNGDLNTRYISSVKKWKRIIVSLIIGMPILTYIMLFMMEARISSIASFTLLDLIESEIGYPLNFFTIHEMAPISNFQNYFLQLLDSLIPIIPTPSYHMDLNVDFSTIYLGYGIEVPWFSILLPSILGESFLIFGNYFYWIHGIIVGIMVALVYRITRENRYMIILFYHYLTCILTTGRAGYEQLSQSILLNYLIFTIGICFIRFFLIKLIPRIKL